MALGSEGVIESIKKGLYIVGSKISSSRWESGLLAKLCIYGNSPRLLRPDTGTGLWGRFHDYEDFQTIQDTGWDIYLYTPSIALLCIWIKQD